MSDTPQVDALDFGDQSRFPGPGYGDLWELARNLEREHAALRERAELAEKELRAAREIYAKESEALKSGGVSDAEVNARLTGVREGLGMAQGILWSTPCHATGKAAQSARDTLRSAVAERLRFAFEKAAGEALHEVPDSGSGWISVKDRLPECLPELAGNSRVVVVCDRDVQTLATWYGKMSVWNLHEPIEGMVPTHWLPLPATPEGYERLHGSVPPSREDYALHSELNKTRSSE